MSSSQGKYQTTEGKLKNPIPHNVSITIFRGQNLEVQHANCRASEIQDKLEFKLTGSNKLCHSNGRIKGIRDNTEADRIPCINWTSHHNPSWPIETDKYTSTYLSRSNNITGLTRLGHTTTICFSNRTPATNHKTC